MIRSAAFIIGVVLLLAWEVVGFLGWMSLYGLLAAIIASSTIVANFALPFLTGAWGYLAWGLLGFGLVGWGGGGVNPDRGMR